jgi:hypothetical protein
VVPTKPATNTANAAFITRVMISLLIVEQAAGLPASRYISSP